MIARLPHFTLVGAPLQTRKGGPYQQRYRIAGEKKTKKVSLRTTDLRTAKRRAVQYVEQRIEETIFADDPQMLAQSSPLNDLLGQYEKYHRSEGHTEGQITQSIGRITRLIQGCGFQRITDLNELAIKSWLTQQRDAGMLGHQTTIHYGKAIKAFAAFVEKTYNVQNPIRFLKVKGKGDVERVFVRRAFTDEEFNQLIANALDGKKKYKVTGPTRALIYKIGRSTGYRASEIGSLTVDSCRLDGDDPVLLVERQISKRRKYDRIPIPASLVSELRTYITDNGLADGDHLFPQTSWIRRSNEMMMVDMDGIEVSTSEGLLQLHSLRHTCVSRTCAVSTSTTDTMTLCRVSSMQLLRNYNHASPARLRSLAEARDAASGTSGGTSPLGEA